MKRSEMVNKISGILANHHPINLADSDGLADFILNELENNEMLPPARYKDMDWNERNITYSQWIQEPSKVNKWEKE